MKNIKDINRIRQIFISIAILWTIIIVMLFFFMVNMEYAKAKEIGMNTVQSALKQDKIFRLWATQHGGFYVPITERTPPNPALKHIPNRDINVKDMNLTLMNPAYALRQMMQEYKGKYGLKGHLTSLKLLNKDDAPDKWEREVLEGYENGLKVEDQYLFLEKDKKPLLRAFEPFITKKGCLKCHAHQGYKIGDVRGGVSMILPMDEINSYRDKNILNIFILNILVWIFGIYFIGYFYRKISQNMLAQRKLNMALLEKGYFLHKLIDTDSNLIVTTFGHKINIVNQSLLNFTGYPTLKDFTKEHSCICDLFEPREGCLSSEVAGKNWIEYIIDNPEKQHCACMKKDDKEYIFNVSANLMDLNGVDQFIVVFNDITELLNSQKNLALAQKIAQVGHWELNLLTDDLYWSDEIYRIFGMSRDKFGANYQAFLKQIHPDDIEMVNDAYTKSLDDTKPYHIIHRIITFDTKEEKVVEERGQHYKDKDGNVIRSLGTVQDITKRKKLEKRLQEKEEMMIAQSRHAAMGEMISMIAHQWRQPITVIAMGANNLLADVELEDVEPENVKQSATMILEQSHHLSKTIDDFKNFFRPNKRAERVLVNDILEENFAIVGQSLKNNNIVLEKEYLSDTYILIYARELLQVFINIFKNAKEALIENKIKDPVISVVTYEDDKSVYISICDNGYGIDSDIISKIYDPYFSTKDVKTGTGLGLYMSKTIVEKHLNGEIIALNGKDSGICFKISLPKVKEVLDGE